MNVRGLTQTYFMQSSQSSPFVLLVRVLDPLRHRREALSTRKESLTRINRVTSSYRSPVFVASFSASVLWNLEASGAITPLMVRTIGVKVPCSTSITRVLYLVFFVCSCERRIDLIGFEIWLSQSAFVTWTSKKACWPSRQKPLALTSRRAPSCVFADGRKRVAPTGCSGGSVCRNRIETKLCKK